MQRRADRGGLRGPGRGHPGLVTASSLDEAATALIVAANEAGGRDNITVVLFRLEEVTGEPGAVAARNEHTIGQAAAPEVPRERAASPAVAVAPAPTTPSQPAVRMRPRPAGPTTAGEDSGAGRRHGKAVAALIAVVVVVLLVGGGGYLATRQLYFIGTNSQGIVTIYRGLPYNLPAGIPMYETYFVSGVPGSLVPLDRRKQIFNNQLRSQTSAVNLVRELELGRVTK